MAKKKSAKAGKMSVPDGITNVIVTGVGGQGALSLATAIAESAAASGNEVKMSELHGLAKRFGHLECHVRFGKKVWTSIVPNGEADLVIALEPLESLVMYKYMGRGRTAVLMDTKRIKPTRMDIERTKYPDMPAIAKTLKATTKSVDMFDASEAAKKAAGATVYANIYLLGKAMKKRLLKLDKGKVMAVLRMLPSPDMNENVFKLALK